MKTFLRYSLSSLKFSWNKSAIEFGEERFDYCIINWVHLFLSSGQHVLSIVNQQIIRRCAFLISFVWKGKNHFSPFSSYFEDFRWPNIIIRGHMQWLRNHHVAPIFADSRLDWISIQCMLIFRHFRVLDKWLDKRTSSEKFWINFSFFVRWHGQLVTFFCYFRPPNRRVENPNSLFHLLSDFESKRTKLTSRLNHHLVPTYQNSP